MNLQEFAALKVGDKINTPFSKGDGEIVETTSSGVCVVWGRRGPNEVKFFYNVVGTAWMQWSKVS